MRRIEIIRSTDRTDEIYRALLRGSHVVADRGAGKTKAILKVAHEMGADQCIVVVASEDSRVLADHKWNEMYPGEQPPRITCKTRALRAVDPRTTVILVDEFSRVQYEDDYHASTDSR